MSEYIGPTITLEPLDSKPRTEVKNQIRKNNHYLKEIEDYASNLFSEQTSKLPTPSKPTPQAKQAHDFQSNTLKKETAPMPPSSLLQRIREMFPPGRQRPSRKHPNKMPPRRATTPEDATDVDTGTIAGKDFARRFVNVNPMTKENMNHNTDRDHQKHEGLALRLPSTDQRHRSRDTMPKPLDHRHRLEEPRSTPEGTVGWKAPAAAANPY
jgi:hypothetical protein